VPTPIKVAAFNCSIKSESGRESSSTDVLLREMMREFARLGAGARRGRLHHPGRRSDLLGGRSHGFERIQESPQDSEGRRSMEQDAGIECGASRARLKKSGYPGIAGGR